MLAVLLLPVFLQSRAAAPTPAWSGDFVVTIKGSGMVQKTGEAGPMQVTWKVDRVARGRIVLDHMFKGGGIAGTPDTRDTTRYETWIANSKQPLEMTVQDTGTYLGPLVVARNITLDVSRFTCPAADGKPSRGQVRSAILQFDRVKGTFSFETPRMIERCQTSVLRTPQRGAAEWMAKAPFDLSSNPVELEFEIWHRLAPLAAWNLMTGAYRDGQEEIVLSRTFTFEWMHPIAGRSAPVQAELQLVLRKGS